MRTVDAIGRARGVLRRASRDRVIQEVMVGHVVVVEAAVGCTLGAGKVKVYLRASERQRFGTCGRSDHM